MTKKDISETQIQENFENSEDIEQQKLGELPGTLIYTGEHHEKIKIKYISYDEYSYDEKVEKDLSELKIDLKSKQKIRWITFLGVNDVEMIQEVGAKFRIHPLVLEDILNVEQRPKIEIYDDYIFVVLRFVTLDESSGKLKNIQVAMIVFDNYLLTFIDDDKDYFEKIRKNIKENKGKIRKKGFDFLVYMSIDFIIDHYMYVLNQIEEKLENVEDEIVKDPESKDIIQLHSLKRDLLEIRNSILPVREVIFSLKRYQLDLFELDNIYLKDLEDHVIRAINQTEALRDQVYDLIQTYLSVNNQKLNEIIKVLTLVQTFFMPLSFIAAWYGMNFEAIREFKWKYGYHYVIALTLAVSLFLLWYIKKKKWI
ncbi:MAG: magnesium/cobalt transporter CorA [Candidatus Woesearchaeota archaeon]